MSPPSIAQPPTEVFALPNSSIVTLKINGLFTKILERTEEFLNQILSSLLSFFEKGLFC